MPIKASHGSAFNNFVSILRETIADCEANHSNYIKVMNKFVLEKRKSWVVPGIDWMTIRLVKYSRSHKEYKLPVQRRACYEMYASS